MLITIVCPLVSVTDLGTVTVVTFIDSFVPEHPVRMRTTRQSNDHE